MAEPQSNPLPLPESSPQAVAEPENSADPQEIRWYQKLLALVGVIFCFEMGVFLLVFPWVSEWDLNYFARLPFQVRDVWVSPYFRGFISGLGLLNIYISLVEVVRLRRLSG